MIDSDSDHRFWGHFNALIGELEAPPYRDTPFYSALASKYQDPIELVEDAIFAIQVVINNISSALARERGVSVDAYLRELIDQKGTTSETTNEFSSQERVRMLREWASGHSANTPLLSDDAISRESIYGERG
jgi:hypothetical protein